MSVFDKYFFSYSNRYTDGSFDLRNVARWHSTGESYYKTYHIIFEDGSGVDLTPNEFYQFEKRFYELEEEK